MHAWGGTPARLVLLALLAGCSSKSDRPPLLSDSTPTLPTDRIPKRTAAFEAADCWVRFPSDEYAADCGYVTAPATASSTDTVKLAVAVVYSNALSVAPEPVVYLDGGPGAGSISDLLPAVPFDSVLADHDLVLFDQRGTGFSTPKPVCDLSETAIPTSSDAGQASDDAGNPPAAVGRAVASCRAQAAAGGVDLSIFRSANNAADVTAVRKALGYSEWNLYGISYGTRYALTTLRDQSAGVKTAIIDSVVPLQADLLSDEGVSLYDDFHRIAQACAEQPACNQTYGDIESKALDVLDQLATSPLRVPLDGGSSEVTPNVVAAVFETAMYSAETIAVLPEIIEEFSDGDFSLFEGSSSEPDTSSIIDTATYLSTVCAEVEPFTSPSTMSARIQSIPEGWRRWFAPTAIFDVCSVWNVPPAPAIEHEPVTSSIPTLIFSGDYDPVTPPSYGALAAQTLSKSQSVVLTAEAHGSSTSDCGKQILHGFLDNPSAKVSSACATESPISFDSLHPPAPASPSIHFVTTREHVSPAILRRIRRKLPFPIWGR